MAGQRLLVLLLLLAAATPHLFAQKPDAAKPASPPLDQKPPARRRGPMSPEFETVRKALDALTPEQRKRFQENFLRWSNLPPEQKKALLDRDEFRRKKMAEDIDAALRETGLDLDPPKRELFVKRYAEERRKVEEQLRKEMEEKRRPLVKEIVARLKAEFSTGAPAPAN